MKRVLIFGLVALAGPGMCQVAFAQNQQTTSQTPLAPKQMEKLLQDTKSLSGLLGIKVAGPNQPTSQAQANGTQLNQDKNQQAASPPATNPTLAKVADKALDMASGLLASIATTLQKTAPETWRIMIRQQYAKAVGDLIVPWMLFSVGLFGVWFLNKKFKHSISGCCVYNCDDCAWKSVLGIAVPWLFLSIGLLWGANRLADSLKYLVNPEFYAIRDLVLLVLNRGQGVN